MKTAFALVFTLATALTSFASPVPSPDAAPALEARGCYVPPPNNGIIDRIYRVAKSMNVNSKVMLAMFECAAVESNYNNLACGDKDSVGVFQARPSQGWGTVDQIMNVEYATRKFLEPAIRIDKERSWLTPGQLAQAVQVSEFPDRYDQKESIARKYLNEAIARNGGSSSGGSTNVGNTPGSSGGSSGSGSNSGSGCSRTWTVKSGNTCSAIASSSGISLSTLYSLNSQINGGCTNLQIGQVLCIQKGSGGTPAATPAKTGGKAAVPSNLASGSTKSCTTYRTVKSGDTCSALANAGGISLSSFYTLNGGVNKSSCNNLVIGKAYCIVA